MIGAIICGVVVMGYIATVGIILAVVKHAAKTRDRLDTQAPQQQPCPWTVRPVSTPMLAEYGVPCLYHVYDPAGNHSCDPSSQFCYLTRTEAEAAARLGEQFSKVVTDAVGGAR